MSDLMLNQIQHVLSTVTDSVQDMGDQNAKNMDVLMGALDDMAANIMATQAVVAVLLKKHPLEVQEVMDWLSQDIQNEGEIPSQTAAVAKYLVTGTLDK